MTYWKRLLLAFMLAVAAPGVADAFEARVEYTAPGSEDVFAVPFEYIQKAHVHATVNGVAVPDEDLVWPSASTLDVGADVDAGQVVVIYRSTPSEPLVTFAAGNLDPNDLNTSALQAIYIAQENADLVALMDVRFDDFQEELDAAVDSALAAEVGAEAAQSAAETAEANSEAALASANTAVTNAQTAETNAEAAQAAAEAAAAGIISRVFEAGTSGGAADAQTVTTSATDFELTRGYRVTFTAGFTNTGAATLAVDASAATALRKDGAGGLTALTAGDIVTGSRYETEFDGTFHVLLNPTPTAAGYALFDAVDASAQRTALSLGTGATANLTNQATAEAGSNNTELMTPLRTKQAADADFARTGRYQVFTASGTWTKPSWVLTTDYVEVEIWGGGGAGGNSGGGGGGGSYNREVFQASSLGSTVTVTIGAGGTTGSLGAGGATVGGTTTFGAHLSAYGGGANTTNGYSKGGGGGGSPFAVGGSTTGTSGGLAGTEGLAGVGAASGVNKGGTGIWGGGGGGGGAASSGSGGDGGNSVYGGAGGAGYDDSGAKPVGGVSAYGGQGGTSSVAATAPGGGGGGEGSLSTVAGARGEARIRVLR